MPGDPDAKASRKETGIRRMRLATDLLGIVALGVVCSCTLLSGAPSAVMPEPGEPPSGQTGAPPPTSRAEIPSGQVLGVDAFEYLGAFRLPGGDERPETFAYGGNAMTYRPDGDPGGSADGFPGSLFITGHTRLPYGELPNGDQVAEIDIPAPVQSDSIQALGQAEFLQEFEDVARGYFEGLDEITRVGMVYLDHPATGPRIHLTWGQHLQPDQPFGTHAWFDPALDRPNMTGPWVLDAPVAYSLNGYMLEIPQAWAETYTDGYPVGTGRFRDGGWSGMGPALHAYRPWTDGGAPAADGSRLPVVTLLQYESSEVTETFEHALAGYQHPDEWEGAAWLTTPDGESAVLFAGTKSTGDKYWYGYVNPQGADRPCVDQELVGQYTVCRMADGTACPDSDLRECAGHTDYRGWWTTRFEAMFLLYDPADLAAVASGAKASWVPQPYAQITIDGVLFSNPSGVETDMLGTGDQRRYRIGEATFDRQNGLLYLLELFADGAKPVVHVWRVG